MSESEKKWMSMTVLIRMANLHPSRSKTAAGGGKNTTAGGERKKEQVHEM